MEYTKIDDTTFQVTKTVTDTQVSTYNLDSLKQQQIDILKKRSDFCDVCDAQLAEIENLISQAESLGLKTTLELEQARAVSADAAAASASTVVSK